ncbi:hypothetical protein LCGC14_2812100, partial [marine sediment metagenome]
MLYAVKDFQRTHLSNPRRRLRVDGIVGPRTLAVINYWNVRKRNRDRNDAVRRFTNHRNKQVEVYAVMDKAWVEKYVNYNTTLSGSTRLAPAKQAIRRMFYHVNYDYDKRQGNIYNKRDKRSTSFQGFPGGKFYVYDIEALGTIGWKGKRGSTNKEIDNLESNMRRKAGWPGAAKFRGYELLTAFSGHVPGDGYVAHRHVNLDQITVTYRANARNARKTLKHELGHILGANEHNGSPHCIMAQGDKFSTYTWSEYHWNFFTDRNPEKSRWNKM